MKQAEGYMSYLPRRQNAQQPPQRRRRCRRAWPTSTRDTRLRWRSRSASARRRHLRTAKTGSPPACGCWKTPCAHASRCLLSAFAGKKAQVSREDEECRWLPSMRSPSHCVKSSVPRTEATLMSDCQRGPDSDPTRTLGVVALVHFYIRSQTAPASWCISAHFCGPSDPF